MLKKLCAVLLSLSMLGSMAVVPAAAAPGNTVSQTVYLGVKDYGKLSSDDKAIFTHCFWSNGETLEYPVSTGADEGYATQNTLQEGYIYDLTVTDGAITAAAMQNGDVSGTVTAIDKDKNSITVDEETVTTDASSAVYSITASAGVVEIKEDTLKTGDTVRVFKTGDVAGRIFKTFVAQDYTAPVSGKAGEKTLKNFLATALEPVGTSLYVYGGAWDWQDVGSSNQATTIGLSQSWIDFFQSQDKNYTYKSADGDETNKDAAHSYYPYGSWNQYYYAGIDCSGYVGWALYNTMNTESGNTGFVDSAKRMAQTCKTSGWGKLTTEFPTPTGHDDSVFLPGDIFSMNGHVWICLGTCDDGSIVFLHSTPSDSKSGQPGGGVQISALNPKSTGKNCQAYRLASYYMTKFFPAWSARYDAVLRDYSDYTSFTKAECGKFSWSLDGANGSLTDPDGYASKTPAQILTDLFHDNGPDQSNFTGRAVYLGVEGYGTVTKNEKPSFQHRFFVMGEGVKSFPVSTGEDAGYAIQNTLQEGYIYDLTVSNGAVTAAELRDGDVSGTVTATGDGYIRVDSEKFFVEDFTASYEITAAAGGAEVTTAPTVQTGDTVRIFVDEDDNITELYKTFVAQDYTAPVSGTPGEKTLKNFLATALEPVGTGLYVYGGTWDWQDDVSSNQSTTIGLSQSWIDFFQSQNADYTYKSKDGDEANKDAAHSYYPYGSWNQYYYAGIDCSAYVAWAAYNVVNTESGNEGYVMGSTGMAKNFANTRGWGTWTQSFSAPVSHTETDFHVGDIFSMNGHVWICLGTCDDGSIVFMHSTPSDSKSGQPGGGVQISAMNPKDTGTNCEAYRLASQYMTTYYPAWSARYDAVLKSYSGYTTFTGSNAGKFTWSLDGSGLLTDPEGYASMTPAQILADLFQQEGDAVYLGVEDYGDRNTNYYHKETLTHRFFLNGAVQSFTVATGEDKGYAIQNTLQEGYIYRVKVDGGVVKSAELLDKGHADTVLGTVTALSADSITVDGVTLTRNTATPVYRITAQAGGAAVTSAQAAVGDTVKIVRSGTAASAIYLAPVAKAYTAPVSGTPGVKTLKNFLATALEPVGTSLYIYGGSWDWQDVGSSNQSTTIGLSQSWIDFFQSQDASYTYKNSADHAQSYYPHEEWNQYYYAGIDCSAYVAWALYNTMNTVSGGEGYVMGATGMAKNFAETRGWGQRTTEFSTPVNHTQTDFHVGDIFSMNGHVWICLGTCDDGSIVFMHSTPSDSKSGQPGGGVQISAMNPKDTGKNCEAYRLASTFMTTYYPAWSARYDAVLRDYDSYTSFTGTTAGKFSWSLDGANGSLTDPEGYASKTPAQILADLFPVGGGNDNGGSSGGNGGGGAAAGGTITVPSGSTAANGSVTLSKTNAAAGETVTATPKADKGYEATGLVVKDSTGKTVSVTKKADGTFDFVMPAGTVSVTPSFEKIQYYNDVPKTAYYAEAVWQLRVDGIMNGKSEGVFSGSEKLNRQQLWTLLARVAGKTPANMTEARSWAIAAGVSDGSNATGEISRQQLAVMLWRQAGSPAASIERLAAFTDGAAVADYAKTAVCWAAETGILTGNNGAVSPEATASRANAAVMVMRYRSANG